MHTEDFVWWTGTVEDIMDPEKLGRIRIRMYGIHTKNKEDIPTDKLPWVQPITPVTSASIDGIGSSPTGVVVGSWVMGFFKDGYNAQDPIVWGTVAGLTSDKTKQPQGGTIEMKNDDPDNSGLPLFGCCDAGESDLNRITREKGLETIRENKKQSIVTEPECQDTTTYPDSTGTISSRSGHHVEINDTPGNERLQTYHKSGSYQDYEPDGSVINRIVADHYEFINGDLYIHIKGDYELILEGELDITVGGHKSDEVGQTVDILSGVSINYDSDGNINLNP